MQIRVPAFEKRQFRTKCEHNSHRLHNSLRWRFGVDASRVQGQARSVESMACICRSCSCSAQRALTRSRHSGGEWSGEDRTGHQDAARDAGLNPGQAKPEIGGSLMEVTPPENEPGFA